MFAPVKVLIVDDQVGVRESLQILFELNGLRPTLIGLARSAVDRIS